MSIKQRPKTILLTSIPADLEGIGENELTVAMKTLYDKKFTLSDTRELIAQLLTDDKIEEVPEAPDCYRLKRDRHAKVYIPQPFYSEEDKDLEMPLTAQEREDLIELEEQVKQGFYLIGVALREIQRRALYREQFKTFDFYVKNKFGFKANYARKQITASEIYDELTPYVEVLPTCESQVRHLSKLPQSNRLTAWTNAVERRNGRVPTEELVKEEVEKILQSGVMCPLDKGDVVVHQSLKKGYWWIVNNVVDGMVSLNGLEGEDCYQYHYSLLEKIEDIDSEKASELLTRFSDIWANASDIRTESEYRTIVGTLKAIYTNLVEFDLSEIQELLLAVLEAESA